MSEHAVDLEEWEEYDPSKGSFLSHMIAGSSAGVAEHIVMFPVDTYKVRRFVILLLNMRDSRWNCLLNFGAPCFGTSSVVPQVKFYGLFSRSAGPVTPPCTADTFTIF
jgi:hypothetical protein